MPDLPGEVTELLLKWGDGDKAALDQLIPIIYAELRRLAKRHMKRERGDHTLQTSALINEAYLRLVKQPNVRWQDRTHFFAAAAQVMRHILIDHARTYQSIKRGAGTQKVSSTEIEDINDEKAAELIALDEALAELAAFDHRKAQVVELHFFGGLTMEEIAESLNVSAVTVMRDWRAAMAWLATSITGKNAMKLP
jgi:RNA polymerase sigma factor (TIGR02999 family)